jgi:hypothetical protein
VPAPSISGPRCNVLVVWDSSDVTDQQLHRYDTDLAVDPGNADHMVGISRFFFGAGANYQDRLEAQYTFDGGLAWKTVVLPGDGSYSVSDPWIGIGVDAQGNSVVYVIAVGARTPSGSTLGSGANAAELEGKAVLAYRSDDGGQSWLGPVSIVSGTWCDNTFGAVDAVNGRVYAIWNDNKDRFNPILAFAASVDGVVWLPSASAVRQNTDFDLPLPNEFNFVNVAVGPDGCVHIVGGNSSGDPALVSYGRSKDFGASFEFGVIGTAMGPNDIESVAIGASVNGVSPQAAVVNPPAIVAAPGGNIVAAWSANLNGFGADPPLMRVVTASCTDNGDGWIQAAANNAAPTAFKNLPLGGLPQSANDHYFRPRLATAGDGTIGCAFSYFTVSMSNPAAPVQHGTCLLVTRSYEEWVPPNHRWPGGYQTVPLFDAKSSSTAIVSDQLTNPVSSVNPVLRWGIANAVFIGDFIGLGASASGYFPYWSDTRNGAALPVMSRVAVDSCQSYIRHFRTDAGDLGAPGAGETPFDAPDLIIRWQPDGTTNFVDQPIPFLLRDLYLYGRIFNKGPAPARNPRLSVVAALLMPGTDWLYPYDWAPADWGPFGINTVIRGFPFNRSNRWDLGSARSAGPIPANSSAILGPIVIPYRLSFTWPGFFFVLGNGNQMCFLARIHVDNDDGAGGAPTGCPMYAVVGPGGMKSFSWQSNKLCQKNVV